MITILQQQSLSITTISDINIGLLLSLSVSSNQCNFIEPVLTCLEDAQKDGRYTPVALYYQHNLCGFAMYGLFEEKNQKRVWFDRYLISSAYQGKGLGKRFARLLMDFLIKEYQQKSLYLSVYEDNIVAIKLYQQLGFKFNGEIDNNGEKVMVCLHK